MALTDNPAPHAIDEGDDELVEEELLVERSRSTACAGCIDRGLGALPQVALRAEAVRRAGVPLREPALTFLRSPDLVELVQTLGDHPSVDDALAASTIEVERRLRSNGRSVARRVRGHPPAMNTTDRGAQAGLDAPICLTWELTYRLNLACIHCLSSSGRRDRTS